MACASSTQNDTNAAYLDHFTCNICLEVLQEPVQCVKNEHYFCKKCITKHLTRSQTCPVCQDALTSETLRRIPRTVANLLEQFQSHRCRYVSRGCMTAVSREALLLHHEECGFAPVQCSHEGCEDTVHRQDLVSHQQACEFRSVTCDDCHEAMKKREYRKHSCVLRKEVDENKQELVEVKRILREIQDEQLRQGEEIQRLAGRKPRDRRRRAMQGQQGNSLLQPAREVRQPNPTRGQQCDSSKADSAFSNFFSQVSCMSSPIQNQATVNRRIFVAGGGNNSYEIFDWSTQKWTLYEETLLFDHEDGFSFVYDNKVMICGGKKTNTVECLDIASAYSDEFPLSMPKRNTKGILYGDKILTFGRQSVSAISLKSPFETTVFAPYAKNKRDDPHCVAFVNENAVVLVGSWSTRRTRRRANSKANIRMYNPTTQVMMNLAPLPYQWSEMAAVAQDDDLIILGGWKQYVEVSNEVLMYNITNQTYRMLPSMLEQRSQCAAVTMGDKIIAIGGRTYSSENHNYKIPLNTVEYMVLGEDRWKKLPAMHCHREGATVCLLP
ncbi:RING finger 151-like isoform X2 [Paramuricea clavata]|uniref:RING finger 151-like isoform X2 n=1 Tax=Paramuricea clavata TaxID=317549 RepID=A0A6S7J1F0_PARCT|nr:RING finger 151-like isoform X2 [Paramuricea clavata]